MDDDNKELNNIPDSEYQKANSVLKKPIDLKGNVKVIWNKVPLMAKLIVIGAVVVFVALILVIILIEHYTPFNHLEFSEEVDTVSDDEEYKEEFESFWYDLCTEESDENCTSEQKEENKQLIKDQKAFYKKLDKKNLTESQKRIVLATIFYGYSVDHFIRRIT